MTAISDAVKTKLNRMNRAAQDAELGTVVQDLQEGVAAASFSEIIGDRSYTEENYLTTEESITDSLDALDVALNEMSIVRGSHIVLGTEETAESVAIDTGITINGFIVQIYRSGILQADYDVSAATTILTIATNSTDYEVTAGDVINYIVWA
jgi:hypothetical protein